MVKYCKGTCKELEIKNHKKIYYLGLKRCSICEVFFKTNEKFCSCCGTSLRNNPRQSRKPKRVTRIT